MQDDNTVMSASEPKRPRGRPRGNKALSTPRPIGGDGKPVQQKTRNITVDTEVQELLVQVQDGLTETFGFRPTLSQTIRHIVLKAAAAK
jgi:hypothetical protein